MGFLGIKDIISAFILWFDHFSNSRAENVKFFRWYFCPNDETKDILKLTDLYWPRENLWNFPKILGRQTISSSYNIWNVHGIKETFKYKFHRILKTKKNATT